MTLFPEKHPHTAHSARGAGALVGRPATPTPARNAGVSPADRPPALPASNKPHWEDRGKGKALVLQFDGGSRGNPGPAGIGVSLTDEEGTPLYELGEFLGRRTNNVAEYTALLRGLHAAKTLGAAKLTVRSDSELLVRQINGIYKVKSPDLKPLFQQAVALINALGDVTVSHVYREGNTRADELANLAMDTAGKIEPLGALSLR
jgi:ribonuclease HI